MSPSGAALRDALQRALVERNEDHGTVCYLMLTEDEALDVASGYVPNSVKAMARLMLDYAEEDRRRAARPVRTKKR